MSLRPQQPTAAQQRIRDRFGLRQRGPVSARSDLDREHAAIRRSEMLAEKFPAGGISRGSLRRQAIENVRRFIRNRAISNAATRTPPVVKRVDSPPPRVLPQPAKIPGTNIKGTRPQDDPIFLLGTVEAPDMSLHRGLLESIGGAIRTGISGRINQAINPQRGIVAAGPAVFGGVRAVAGRVLPAIGRVLGSRSAAAAATGLAVGSLVGGGGGNGCPSGFHPNKQDGSGGPAGTYCVRNRRINFGNARAARRSVRRLKGARKLLKDIEKMMPSKTTRRRAPAGHTTHLHHSGG